MKGIHYFNNFPILHPQASRSDQRNEFSYLDLCDLCYLQEFYLALPPQFDFAHPHIHCILSPLD